MIDPQDSVGVFALLDDGLGPDLAAGDGIYTGEIIDNSLTGQYEVAVEAQGTLPGGGALNRATGGAYFVAVRPDVEVLPTDLLLYPSSGYMSFTIEATMRNVGTATADTVVVKFLEGTTGLAFAESVYVALAPAAEFTIAREWLVPPGLSEVALGVRVAVLGDPVEDTLSNNEAWATSPILDIAQPSGSDSPLTTTLFKRWPSAYPNPVQGNTRIRYVVTKRSSADVRVFDVSGRQVWASVVDAQDPGIYEAVWDARDDHGRDVAPGVYFYRIATNGWDNSGRLLVVR